MRLIENLEKYKKSLVNVATTTPEERTIDLEKYRLMPETKQLTGQPSKPGLIQSMAQGIVSAPAKLAATGWSFLKGVGQLGLAGIYELKGDREKAMEQVIKAGQPVEMEGGWLGTAKPIESFKEAVGTGMELAGMLLPAGEMGKVGMEGIKSGGAAFLKGFLKATPYGAVSGGLMGAGTELQKDKDLGEIAKATGIGIFSGGLISGTLGGLFARSQFLAPQKAQELKNKAIEMYQRGLQTTKEKYKEKAQKIIPDLLENKIWGKFSTLIEKVKKGIALNLDEYKQLGELQGIVSTEGIEDMIKSEMAKYTTAGGRVISVNKGKVATLQNLLDDIVSLRGVPEIAEVTQQSLRKLAEQYGEVVYETRKAQKTIMDSQTLSQVKKVDSAIREVLNTNNPDYAAINKVFHRNTELYEILKETAKRKGGQKWFSLINSIMTSTGVSGGAIAGILIKGGTGAFTGAIIGGTALLSLSTILNSTWFNTLRAVQRSKVAEKLLALPAKELPRIINLIAIGGAKFMDILLEEK